MTKSKSDFSQTSPARVPLGALFLVLAIVATPVVTEAQPAGKVYRVGVLSPEAPPSGLVEAFSERLHELGYIEGKNITLESRHAGGRPERLAVLAEELVRLRVDVIVAVNTPAAQAESSRSNRAASSGCHAGGRHRALGALGKDPTRIGRVRCLPGNRSRRGETPTHPVTRIVWAPQAIVAAVERLADHPRSGRVVPELGDESIREIIHGHYRIVYRLRGDVVEIATVFHGARLFQLD